MSRNTDKLPAACLIMAGGAGRRLSPDKPFLKIEGRMIISRVVDVVSGMFDELYLVTNRPEKYQFLNLPHISDEKQGCGPLMGIYSGLKVIKSKVAFVCAVDMPFLNEHIIRREFEEVAGYDMVVPYPNDLPEFLHAYYHVQGLSRIKENLDNKCYKIDKLREILNVKILDEKWFTKHQFQHLKEKAFTNINTPGDYQIWGDKPLIQSLSKTADTMKLRPPQNAAKREVFLSTKDPVDSITKDVLGNIKQMLVNDESHYQRENSTAEYSSLWSHSVRVALIAHHLALKEGRELTATVLAALFHDVGKFYGGRYHRDNEAEEERAVVAAKEILTGTAYEPLLPVLSKAVLSLYRDNIEPTGIGAILYDADRLDKLGYMGIAQFFSKNALRGKFLDNDLMKRGSIELTYAYHAPYTLKTSTARQLAVVRSSRVRNYFLGLLEEWKEMGLGAFSLQDSDVEGIKLVLVIPDNCRCESCINIYTDIREAVKCRSAVVKYSCPACKEESEFSFCLPVLSDFPSIS